MKDLLDLRQPTISGDASVSFNAIMFRLESISEAVDGLITGKALIHFADGQISGFVKFWNALMRRDLQLYLNCVLVARNCYMKSKHI